MGRYLEDFTVGEVIDSPRRTITEADVVAYAMVTGDWNPIHTDRVFAEASMFGERIAHGPLTIGMAFGLLSRRDILDGTVLALKRITWELFHPVRFGDSILARMTTVEASPHPTAKDRGRVTMKIEMINQDGVVVSAGEATIVFLRRP